jgi:hypothetical protein
MMRATIASDASSAGSDRLRGHQSVASDHTPADIIAR